MADEETKDAPEGEGGENEAASSEERDAETHAEAAGAAESSDSGDADGSEDREEADDSGDDESSDESGAAGKSDAKSTAASKAAKPKSGQSAGARLAAQMAAKAAKKAAKKGKADASEPEAIAEKRAGEIAAVVKARGPLIWGGLGVALAIAGALLGYTLWSSSQAQAAAALLDDAVEAANAPIVDEDETLPESMSTRETFPTITARAEASIERFQKVITERPGSDAAKWARLGEARALFDLGRNDEARAAFQKALDEGGAIPAIASRAMEGLAFTFESEQKWDEAIERFQQLSNLRDGAFRDLAEYHLARMYLAKGDAERGKETLKTVVERLRNAEDPDEPTAFPYVLAQAELRLAEIDPSLVPRAPPARNPFGGGGGMEGLEGLDLGGGEGGDIDPEQLQELIRRFQQQQGGGGAPPPPSE